MERIEWLWPLRHTVLVDVFGLSMSWLCVVVGYLVIAAGAVLLTYYRLRHKEFLPLGACTVIFGVGLVATASAITGYESLVGKYVLVTLGTAALALWGYTLHWIVTVSSAPTAVPLSTNFAGAAMLSSHMSALCLSACSIVLALTTSDVWLHIDGAFTGTDQFGTRYDEPLRADRLVTTTHWSWGSNLLANLSLLLLGLAVVALLAATFYRYVIERQSTPAANDPATTDPATAGKRG